MAEGDASGLRVVSNGQDSKPRVQSRGSSGYLLEDPDADDIIHKVCGRVSFVRGRRNISSGLVFETRIASRDSRVDDLESLLVYFWCSQKLRPMLGKIFDECVRGLRPGGRVGLETFGSDRKETTSRQLDARFWGR